MKFIFLMDPMETVNIHKDTTFILMVGAHNRGHEVYFLPEGGITIKDNKLWFHVTQVVPQKKEEQQFIKKQTATLSEDEVDCVFIRTDPPFDSDYLLHTWLLDKLPKRVTVINNPAGVRTANEKIWCMQFTSVTPKTLLSRQRDEILQFLGKEKEAIAKPTDGHGGTSVFHVRQNDNNAKVILETLTQHWKTEIILQQYIPESQNGDKRILLLDGEPLGAVLRLHAEDDHRNNFFSGGKPKPATVNEHDQKIINILKPELKKLGLYFVGIDILGDYLVEVNVTSPTCLQEMSQFLKTPLEEKVIAFAEKCVDQNKTITTM